MSSPAPCHRVLAVFLAAAAILAGCTSGEDDRGMAAGGASTTTAVAVDGSGTSAGSIVAHASVEFVTSALSAGPAQDLILERPVDDPAVGAPFEPDLLSGRLVEIRALSGVVETVRPSETAHTAVPIGLGPACAQASVLSCEVDLFDSAERVLASIVVYWLDDGVIDFSIVRRDVGERPVGIGEALCSQGYELLHGGHTPDRFDIAVCIGDGGAVEYNGAERGKDLGIRLAACARDRGEWTAVNEGFRYVVNGSASAPRSEIEVFDPDGDLLEAGFFTTVSVEHDAAALPC